jgi:predicted secreted protein
LKEYRQDDGGEKPEAAEIVSMEVPEEPSKAKVWRLNRKGDGKCHEQEKPDDDETSNNVPSSSCWEYVWLRNSDRQFETEY